MPPVLIVLAGGRASRMWPIKEKSLLRFGTEPLLVSQLQGYRKLGFKRVIIVANPTNKAEIAAYTAPLDGQIQLDIIVQPQALGMGDALLQAQPLLEDTPNAPLYVTQVHDVVDNQLHVDMLMAFNRDPSKSYIAGVEINGYFPGGYLIIGENRRIKGIVEKPGAENRPSNLVNVVAHIHSNAAGLFAALRENYVSENTADGHYERSMSAMMQADHVFQVVPYKGFWGVLKYPWHVLDIMDYYLNRISGQVVAEDAFIAPTATLAGNVYIGANAKIYPGASVVGPVYIGANTTIGNNALVRGAMVMNNCEVGFTTEVARSYIADRCALHACRVLDSVFAEDVNFSAGCTTANLRLDRAEVRSTVQAERRATGRRKFGAVIGRQAFIGVDALTMPGVKIGARTRVGPGTHIYADVADDKRVYVKQQLTVEDSTPSEPPQSP
jgi:UDP-N-acetylglucosamine diphosphorylase / glucose-1-phosphate thymidylyltransferase / UDP-N-acetylgalactosamine diphosphorylase / glucosamine-1-phosphate N-acetyltransferase / galactosamine-1-phosphate N-acetyltransferase